MSEPVLQIPTGWEGRAPQGWEWQTLWTAIEEGDHRYTHERVQQAIDAGIDPRVILDDGLFPGFNLQGDRFSEQIIFIPEMLITARAMKAGLGSAALHQPDMDLDTSGPAERRRESALRRLDALDDADAEIQRRAEELRAAKAAIDAMLARPDGTLLVDYDSQKLGGKAYVRDAKELAVTNLLTEGDAAMYIALISCAGFSKISDAAPASISRPTPSTTQNTARSSAIRRA